MIKKKWLDNDKMFLDDFQVHPEQTLKESNPYMKYKKLT